MKFFLIVCFEFKNQTENKIHRLKVFSDLSAFASLRTPFYLYRLSASSLAAVLFICFAGVSFSCVVLYWLLKNILGHTLYIVTAWSVPVEYDCRSILSLCPFPLHNSLDNDTCLNLALADISLECQY